MRKLGITAIAVVACATFAWGASLSVPWFVDSAPAANDIPGNQDGVTGVVTLKSNVDTVLTLSVTYFNADGDNLGPDAPSNTFTIQPQSALAFRPVATDPGTVPGGQEGSQGVAVPDRPRSPDATTDVPGRPGIIDRKKNGSITIEWQGGPSDIQGQVAYFKTSTIAGTGKVTVSYAHLLPPGVS